MKHIKTYTSSATNVEPESPMGNGWVQFALSGYHGQDAFQCEIQLDMDNPDTYIFL